MTSLTDQLRAFLPSSISRQCRVAGYDSQTLTIVADNSSVATRLRYEEPRILPRLRQIGDFSHIRRWKIESAGTPETPADQ